MEQKRKITAEDLYKLKFVSDPQIAPAGNEVAYVLTSITEEKEYQSGIWLAGGKGEPMQFTFVPGKSDSSPRWSPTGDQIAFISNRSGERQIWVISRFGGEARQLTHMYHGVNGFAWSPDGKRIAFLSAVKPDDELATLLREKTEKEREQEKKDKTRKARVITGMRYKFDDVGFLDGKENHIWIMDLKGGEPERLTTKVRNYGKPVWSPDGKKLLSATHVEEPEFYPGEGEIWLFDLQTHEEKQLISTGMEAHAPSWSPDGLQIAFIGHRLEYKGATLGRVHILDLETGEMRILAGERDFGIGDFAMSDLRAGGADSTPIWSLDGLSVYVPVSELGNTSIYRIGLDDSLEKALGGRRQIYGFTMDDDKQRIAFTYTTPMIPGDLAILDLYTRTEKRLTDVNADLLAEVALAEPEEIIFTGADGWKIQGWVMKPVGYVSGEKYPLILEIHGGPHAMYSNSFFHEFQLLAAQGYGVVYSNPRGGHGYGQKFVDACRGDYGGKDYEDLMALVDHAIKWEWVDAERLGVTGGSYGGFMTNWIVGHTNRFKAAVTQRSISNWQSFGGVSDIGYFFNNWEHKLNFLTDREEMTRISPITYVEAVQTPLLILHGENDYRCPLEQAEQLYIQLKYLRKTTELVIFPGANHNLSRNGKPELRVERLNQIAGWFNRFI